MVSNAKCGEVRPCAAMLPFPCVESHSGATPQSQPHCSLENELQCHPSKMMGSNEIGAKKFSTLLWTPLTHRKELSESYTTHAISCKKMKKMTLEHLHPAVLKGLGKPFKVALEKNLAHPSPIPRP